ncbi:hypothetical protein SBRY_90053 [Actinacidiphila bryophytorum]|uniref:Uncharacterized protein n=1 Tax=Actinacidiphila bryophytorum TaxID=1436133 RepID=A0A9W4H8A5_9ACTN|nr:hypothetical protein SBRY_90053 [Actinacidiphila bryophytorum]
MAKLRERQPRTLYEIMEPGRDVTALPERAWP